MVDVIKQRGPHLSPILQKVGPTRTPKRLDRSKPRPNHVGTAAPGCPAEQSSAVLQRAPASPNFSAPSDSTNPFAAASLTNFPEANASASASPAPWRCVPNSSSATNPSPPSTSASERKSSTCSPNCNA